jgi:hypothetical protein
MSSTEELRRRSEQLFDHKEVEGVLRGSFYTPTPGPQPRPKRLSASARPKHYKVICISMYNDDLHRLDDMVRELKRRGYTKANRSALIRHALGVVDLDQVPRGI